MSVADLKIRLRDVSGIETLTMRFASGSILLQWGAGYSATVGAAASDAEIMSAIRDAVRLPPVSLIPDKPAPAVPANPKEGKLMTDTTPAAPAAAPGAAALSIQQRLADHGKKLDAILQAQGALLDAALNEQANAAVSAVSGVVEKIKSQTADFNAIMGQISNIGGNV